jgi:hypothetical protein
MARNRKNQSAAIRFAPAIWALLLCLLIGGSGVGYVWLKGQIRELGQQQGKRERRLAELRDQNEKLRRQLAELRTVSRLEARVRELNLGLGPPARWQIVSLIESNRDTPAPASVSTPQGRLVAQQARPNPSP